jgi:hypothetical protein
MNTVLLPLGCNPSWSSISFLAISLCLFLSNRGISQCTFNPISKKYESASGESCINSIITAVPFLRIIPDARSAGMGDAGLATSADPSALHFNASKLAFAKERSGLGLTYSPWLRALEVDNLFFAYASGYHQLNHLNTVGVSLRYFSLGDIAFTNANGMPLGNGRPNELEIKGAFIRKLSERLAAEVGFKYIYSNLAAGQSVGGRNITAGKSLAFDFSATYQLPHLTFGLALTNLGQKITYTNSVNKDFIPANIGIGVAWNKQLNETTTLTLTTDINKLLVPTPDLALTDADLDGVPDYKQASTLKGAFSSFGDAPNGFSEELRELMFSFGAELITKYNIALRTGFFGEHSTKGNRKYITTGLGYTFKMITINGSYLMMTNRQNNPLDNTFRLSLLLNFNAGNKVKEG